MIKNNLGEKNGGLELENEIKNTSLKTNMTGWTITISNKRYIFTWLFFHCHVSFRGCKAKTVTRIKSNSKQKLDHVNLMY